VADTTYPNLNLVGPEVNSSDGTWGGKLNNDLLLIDNQFAPSGTGTVIRRNAVGNAAAAGIDLTAAAGVAKLVSFFTATTQRWLVGSNATAESGGNVGSDFAVSRFADGGTVIDTPLTIARSSGIAAFTQVPTAAGSAVLTQGTAGAFAPVIGAVQMFAGSFAPTNWMICDGSAISRTTFAALFSVVSTTYGAGDGTTTFNIPNLRGKVAVGVDGSTQFPVLGSAFGELSHTTTTAEMPSHNHTLHDPGHVHTITPMRSPVVSNTSTNVSVLSATAPNTGLTTDSAVSGITLDASGGGAPHNNVQPSLALNFIIRVQ
jgi:microcystin-dependent protein